MDDTKHCSVSCADATPLDIDPPMCNITSDICPMDATIEFDIPKWSGRFDAGSGVLRSLRSRLDPSFDFQPADVFMHRQGTGQYHLGDFSLRWRDVEADKWAEVDTASRRDIRPRHETGSLELLRSRFDGMFPSLHGVLELSRSWTTIDGDLALIVAVHNIHTQQTIELGAFGFAIEFNNIFTGRTKEETTNRCVLVDPCPSRDAGYLQVTRLTGLGPHLVVTPVGANSGLEAWRFLEEPRGEPLRYQSHTFEGHYAWQTLTKAFVENEWKNAEPWNAPSSCLVAPGDVVQFGLRFTASPTVDAIEEAVASTDTPVAVGLPGYILPADLTGKLYLKYPKATVANISTVPEGALCLTPSPIASATWRGYNVEAAALRGRVCIEVRYDDGKVQTIHYLVKDTAPESIARLGRFLFDEQWYEDSDVFHRSPGILTYDYKARSKVLQDRRVWIAGLQDEGGAASWVAAAMKTAFHPAPEEVDKLEAMACETIWGNMQYDGSNAKYPAYSVKRSLFYYDPAAAEPFEYDPKFDWTGWASWTKEEADKVWRPFNYVWISGLYWSLYRAERMYPGMLKRHDALWYLNAAARTLETCYSLLPNNEPLVDFRDVGLMGEIIWYEMMQDLRLEGLEMSYNSARLIMRERQQVWAAVESPFGSEAPWDSTGQEAVYLWSKYFGDSALVNKTLDSIRGYMPTIAHWAYNGNARRYWDFDVAGKLARIERQVHHYGSPLNAIPLLDHYQYATDPSSRQAIHDLRVGFGGWLGALSNINEDGFASQAFHARPDTMKWDDFSSDYGAGLPGHMIMSLTVLFDHPDFGLVAMAGNSEYIDEGVVKVFPRDTVRRRIYVAPLGLQFTLSAGSIADFTYNALDKTCLITVVGPECQQGQSKTRMTWRSTRHMQIVLTAPQLDVVSSEGCSSTQVQLPADLRFAATI